MNRTDKALLDAFREGFRLASKWPDPKAEDADSKAVIEAGMTCAKRLGADLPGAGTEPAETLLVSMALRLDHGFGLREPAARQAVLEDMRKVWEEVVGKGFYNPEHADRYRAYMPERPAQSRPEGQTHTGDAADASQANIPTRQTNLG